MPRSFRHLLVVLSILLVSASFSFADTVSRIKLLQTGQVNTSTEKALVEKTFLYPLYPPHDDGDLQMGLKWTASTRFKDNGNGTITDTLTGLTWMKDGNLPLTAGYSKATPTGTVNWSNAFDFINKLNFGTHASYNANYQDWRLPNITELESLTTADKSCASMLASGGFKKDSNYSIVLEKYASSTTFAGDPEYVFTVNMNCGKVLKSLKNQGFYVIPVRGHTGGNGGLVWKTGQIKSYAANDDGALTLQEGVAWPDPRFVSNSDGTVTDRLTGLSWLRDAGTPAFGSFKSRGPKTWLEALAYVDELNAGKYLGHDDWRLPNRRELFSLVDFSQFNPALPTGNNFINVKYGGSSNYYWSSTTHYSHWDEAFRVNFEDGSAPFYFKGQYLKPDGTIGTAPSYVWPVRGDTTAPDPLSPVSRVTSPADGAYLPGPLGTYNITGTAGGGEGGIQDVCVSTDGGTTWKSAADTSSGGTWSTWSYSWTPAGPGKYNLKSKALDNTGREEMPGRGVNVYAGVYRLSVSASPSNGGSVSLSPAGGTYNEGAKVKLTAAHAPKFIFTGWSGDLTGTQNPAEVTMDKSKTVVANFASPDYTLTVSAAPQEGGTVQASPQGTHKPRDVVSLKAVPAEGYLFGGWEGNVADPVSESTTIVMDGDETVTARFRKKNGVTLALSQDGQSATFMATLYDEGQISGRPVKFRLSSDGGNAWAEKGKAATATDGTCSKRLRLRAGSYKTKASCVSAGGQTYESPVVDANIAQVQAVSPAPKAVVHEPTPAVSWTPVQGATGYEVKVSSGKTALGTVTAPWDATGVNLPPLPMGRRARWSVTALLPTGKSIPSRPRTIIYK